MDEEKLQDELLFLAATRPALVGGIPLSLAGVFLMLVGFIIVLFQNPLYELMIAPLWFGARLLVSRDYNAVDVVFLYLRTKARSIDSSLWGGASVSPNPIKLPKRGRGIE